MVVKLLLHLLTVTLLLIILKCKFGATIVNILQICKNKKQGERRTLHFNTHIWLLI